MVRYIFKRIVLLIPVAFIVATSVFILSRATLPGDPVDFILGEQALPQDVEYLRAQLQLDESLWKQYAMFIKGVVCLDLGKSIFQKVDVVTLIAQRLVATVKLAVAAMIVAVLVSLPLGVIAAIRKGGIVDLLAMLFSILGVSMPNFWLGPLLILLFAVELGWLPVSGMESRSSIVLPAVTLGTALAAMLSRMIRSSMIDSLASPYIAAVRAKGIKEVVVVFKHALRNALNPVITIIGLQFGSLLAGAVVTEKIFNWPGIGTLFLDAIFSRDYPLIQGCALVVVLAYVVVNTFTDCLYRLADPRVRLI